MLEEEVTHLREQLRETVDENGRLYKLLKERDFEIKHLKKKIEEDRSAFTGSSTTVVAVPGPKCRGLAKLPWHPLGRAEGRAEGRCSRESAKGQLRSGCADESWKRRRGREREWAKEARVPGHRSAGAAGTVGRHSGRPG